MLSGGEGVAITNKEKVELMVKSFVKVHSLNNLSEEGKRGREKTKEENLEPLQRKESEEGEQNVPFSMRELNRALAKTGKTAAWKDGICYIMLKRLSE